MTSPAAVEIVLSANELEARVRRRKIGEPMRCAPGLSVWRPLV